MNLKLKKSDFLMAKRLKRRFARENKDRAGCMSGIISIFDFRHGRITRRLLSDHRTYMTESTTGPSCPISEGPSCPTSEVNSVIDSEETHQRIESLNNENNETTQRVKELMEEDMQCDEIGDLKYQINSEISTDHQVPTHKTPQYHDLEDFVNRLLRIHEKRNEEQNPKSMERLNSFNHERTNSRSEEQSVTRKNQNFFRRRSKSNECISLNDNDTPHPPSNTTTNGFHHERSVSHFSFTEIKKKLKNAIGRSPRDLKCPEKPVVEGNSGWSSPNRDHFHSERFSRISNRFSRQETRPGENKSFGDTSDRISNIYIEAKKHLSEILNNGDDVDTELVVERHSRTLGKLLSFPNYNSLSSGIGSRNKPVVNETQPFMTDDEPQEPEVSDEVHHTEDVVEIVKPPEEIEVSDAPDLTEEDESSCSAIAFSSESSLFINRKIEEAESILDDRTDKPSHVSVLEPLFSDDDISPARTISQTAQSSLQPLRIRFEETVTSDKYQETCTINHVENEESVFEYIETMLLASDLNWDEFEHRWLSSVQILDPSLYQELQIFSNRPSHDQLLLFDATNEILKEVCDHCLGFFPELLCFKPNIHPLPKGMGLINEVWGRIESRLNCYYPRSLDQLIKKDFEVSRTWFDHRSETREIVMEIEELICENMIDETVFSLMHMMN